MPKPELLADLIDEVAGLYEVPRSAAIGYLAEARLDVSYEPDAPAIFLTREELTAEGANAVLHRVDYLRGRLVHHTIHGNDGRWATIGRAPFATRYVPIWEVAVWESAPDSDAEPKAKLWAIVPTIRLAESYARNALGIPERCDRLVVAWAEGTRWRSTRRPRWTPEHGRGSL